MTNNEDLPDFDSMTLDELIDWRVAQKREYPIEKAKERVRASNEVYTAKVHKHTIETKLRGIGVDIQVTPEMVTMYAQGQVAGPTEEQSS